MSKQKRPLWRRVLRGFAIFAGVVVTLVVLLIAFLHTPWGKSVVRGRVEAKLAARLNGEIHIGSIDYSFLFGDVTLGDVEIRDASGRRAIAFESLAIDLDRASLLDQEPLLYSVVLRGLDVAVVKSADGRSNLTGLFKPSKGTSLARVRVAHLAIDGKASLTKADGTAIAVERIAVAGSVDARPLAKELDAALAAVSAHVTIAKPNAEPRALDVSLASATLLRRPTRIELALTDLAAGVLDVDTINARIALEHGRPHGEQLASITGLRIHSERVAELLGRDVLSDDVALDATVSGTAEQLVLAGTVHAGTASMRLDGNLDRTGRPRLKLAITGDRLRSDLVRSRESKLRIADAEVNIDLSASGRSFADLEADLAIDIEALGAKLAARAVVAPGKRIDARVHVGADVTRVTRELAASGIRVPARIPLPSRLDLDVTATGELDGSLAVRLAPTTLPFAGGQISIKGGAQLQARKLETGGATIMLSKLDLASLAKLAGKQPKLHGTLGGTVELGRSTAGKQAAFDLAIALRDAPVQVRVNGTTDLAKQLSAHVAAQRATDRAVLATIAAELPLAKQNGKLGVRRDGALRVELDFARRSLGELAVLLPERLRAKLPAGDVEAHIDLGGSLVKPAGTFALAATVIGKRATERVELAGTLATAGGTLSLATTGTVSLDQLQGPVAVIAAEVAAPFDARLDRTAMRAGAIVEATIDLPERPLASLAFLRPRLAKLDGQLGGRITARGPAARPDIAADLAWRGYRVASGATSATTLAARGTPTALTIEVRHAGALAIDASVARSADRIEIDARTRADSPLVALLPAFVLTSKQVEPGHVKTDLGGRVTLVRGAGGLSLHQLSTTGGLAIAGAALAIPSTSRRIHGIGLELASDPSGLRIKSLVARESDAENKDRRITGSGALALDGARPRKLDLSLVAHDWLLFGSPTLGPADAPRAAVDFDIGAAVDFTAPVLAVDATVNRLALRAPERFERGHQPEHASIAGDIIYVDKSTRAGALPVAAPATAAAPRKRRPMDIRIHIPKPIRIVQTPFDLVARGELTVAVRETGATTRGVLAMDSGTLDLFGHTHSLLSGSFSFTDEHPRGHLELVFARALPNATMRDLSRTSAGSGSRITFAGPLTKPKVTLGGTTQALAEVMATYNAGRPVHATELGAPASTTVQAPRGDQLFVLTFMAQNLPHLMFLDKISAWADPYRSGYGRVENVEAERRIDNARIRAVTRPATPGRSSAELHYDRMLIDTDRAAVGVGVRAGSRGGGGVGIFVEWSSDD
jgi:hypothetical protein